MLHDFIKFVSIRMLCLSFVFIDENKGVYETRQNIVNNYTRRIQRNTRIFFYTKHEKSNQDIHISDTSLI
jgi:hypothetical protein